MTTTAASVAPRQFDARAEVASSRFYVRIAEASLAIALLGFAPTYWAPMARASLHVSPIVHVHAALFFGWTLLFVVQTRLAAADRIDRHQELGVVGVSWATAMCIVGPATAINSIKRFDALGFVRQGRAFSIVSFVSIFTFAVLLAIALANVKRPAIHKRLMIILTASLLPAAIGRWFVFFFKPPGALGPPPLPVVIPPSILADLLIVAGMVYDRRTRGRVHPVYWVAGGALFVVQMMQPVLGNTNAWIRATDWIVAFAP
jgi:hypothetical protein